MRLSPKQLLRTTIVALAALAAYDPGVVHAQGAAVGNPPADVAHYDAFNKVYRGFFKQEYPARAFLGSGKLLFGARFEVQGIAVKR